MSDAFAIAALSMTDDMQRMATISHNLANVTTPGFKREVALDGRFAHLLQGVDPALAAQLAGTALDSNRRIDSQPGSVRFTGNPLDLALESTGYFELAGAEGPVYTRQGDFHLDARGRLVNANGLAVMGASGEIVLQTSDPKIERDGRIFENGRLVAQLRIVDFENPDALLKAGNGLYVTRGEQLPKEASETLKRTQVRQAFLENSNVVAASEMVRMIETMRHFESQQKVIQGYDEMLEKVLRSVGDV